MDFFRNAIDQPILKPVEKFLSSKLGFSMVVLVQGLMGGSGLQLPAAVESFLQNKMVQFIARTLIAFTATQSIIYAVATVALLEVVFYFLSTSEEKKQGRSFVHDKLNLVFRTD